MPIILIVLLAAAGIGGGIAASSGGGGGDSVGGNVPPAQMDVISRLSLADRVKNTVAESRDWYGDGLEDVSFSADKISVNVEIPVLENGYFKQEWVEGDLEPVIQNQEVDFTQKDYQKSDAYADYYRKEIGTWSGLINAKENTSDPDLYINESLSLEDWIVLGGRKAGLEDVEFGYHMQKGTLNGESDSYYGSFYAYDQTRLASASRSDTVTYQGNMLGSMNMIDDDDWFIARPLAGPASFALNFATKELTGSIEASSEGKKWYNFDVAGNITSKNSFDITEVTLEGPLDDSLSAWSLNQLISLYGVGNILVSELTGDLDLTYRSHLGDEISAYMVYGAKENTPVQNPEDDTNYISELVRPEKYSFTRFYKDVKDSSDGILYALNGALGINGKMNYSENGELRQEPEYDEYGQIDEWSSIEKDYYESLTWDNHVSSDAYANLFSKQITSDEGWYKEDLGGGSYRSHYLKWTETDLIALGGKKAGLTEGDFGYQVHSHDMYGHDTYNNALEYYGNDHDYSTFYAYNSSRLADTSFRSNTAHFNGTVLGAISVETDNVADADSLLSEEATRSINGTSSFDLDFAAMDLSGNIQTYIDGKKYYSFEVSGEIDGSDLALEVALSNQDVHSSLQDFLYTQSSSWGNGKLLTGSNNKLELVGSVESYGYLTATTYEAETNLSFGALETTTPFVLNPNYQYISALTDYSQYSSAKIIHVEEGVYGKIHPLRLDYNQSGAILWDTNLLYVNNGWTTETPTTFALTQNDAVATSSNVYDLYRHSFQIAGTNSYGNPIVVNQQHDLYLGGKKLGLQVSDFGFAGRYRDWEKYSTATDFILYDSRYLYSQVRRDYAQLTGNVLMISDADIKSTNAPIHLYTGTMDMNIDFSSSNVYGSVDMTDNRFDISSLSGFLSKGHITFSGANELDGFGKLLSAPNGLESVGFIDTIDGSYTYGVKEVK